MKKHLKHIAGVLIGLLILTGVVWLLSQTLGNLHMGQGNETLYAGQSVNYWLQQLDGRDAGASNTAYAVVNAQVIPQLIDTMYHDTNDSKIRLALISVLNRLPGIQIAFEPADVRRSRAAISLGELGPAGRAALPDLIKALKGNDTAIRWAVIISLGKIRSEPGTVIPLLIPYLEDNNYDALAANALAEFGSLAKPAIPKLLPLLHSKDDDDQDAAKAALKKIDPIAASKAGVK